MARHPANEKGASNNTISAYRDAFVLLINFMKEAKKVRVEKLTLQRTTRETIPDA